MYVHVHIKWSKSKQALDTFSDMTFNSLDVWTAGHLLRGAAYTLLDPNSQHGQERSDHKTIKLCSNCLLK